MYTRYQKLFEDSRSFHVYRASFYVLECNDIYIFHIKANWMMEATRNKSEILQIERFQLIWNQDKDKMYLR